MTTHEGFLDLAAAAIDFDLDDRERADLELHLAGCDACRRAAAGFRDDAATIASGPRPHLSPERSAKILAAALRPRRRSSPMRLLAVAALIAVIGSGAILVGTGWRPFQDPVVVVVVASPSPSATGTSEPSSVPTGGPTPTAGLTAAPSAATPGPTTPANGPPLTVGGSGQELGTAVLMAPRADGGLYVTVPTPDGTVLALLDPSGRPADGWPITIPDTTGCDLLLPADDGSVRVVCTMENPNGDQFNPVGAFGYDASGGSLPGWPVILGDHGAVGHVAGRVIGNDLAILAWTTRGDVIAEGEPSADGWILAIAADGTARDGTRVPFELSDGWAIGPDGVAYGIVHALDDDFFAPARTSELFAIAFEGARDGFPVTIEGIASQPAFDGAGRIRLTVAAEAGGPARTVAFDAQGEAAVDGPFELGFAALGNCDGGDGSCSEPAPPLVDADGTTTVVGSDAPGTVVGAVESDYFRFSAGWPYRSDGIPQTIGTCPVGEICEVATLAPPALGPGGVVYLIHGATDSSVGGSLVAIGSDGVVVDGWPVGLTRPGAAFWSLVVGADGTVYALAIEPEAGGASSATVLAIEPDSTVRSVTTLIEP